MAFCLGWWWGIREVALCYVVLLLDGMWVYIRLWSDIWYCIDYSVYSFVVAVLHSM